MQERTGGRSAVMKKTTRLREMMAGPGIVRVAGAHNPLGAKLVQSAGFSGVWASGLEISTAQALPDANILTMTEFLQAATSMSDAVGIPVIADCDTGFGNSNNVIHMVRKYEKAGIAAVCIEDKRFPKVNSFVPGRQDLTTVAEFVGKIMAAKSAQTDPDFMVVARVEALIAGQGLEEALRRAHAYVDAGADAILIHSKSDTPEEIFAFAGQWEERAPLIAIPTTYYSVTCDELEKAGVRVVIYANHGIRASIFAMQETLAEIYRSGTSRAVEHEIATMKQVFEIQDMPGLKAAETLYLRTGDEEVSAIIPAAGDHLEEYSMKQISSDIPIAALDIKGKTLLKRQVEALNRVGVREICVIGGYRKDQINVEGIRLMENAEYQSTGILYSIMCARDQMEGRVLVVYGDILFDMALVERILKVKDDIAILVDPNFDARNYGPEKKLDLVVSDGEPVKSRRKLRHAMLPKVVRIGHEVSPGEAHYEFPGIMILSQEGSRVFRDIYEISSRRYRGRSFHGAPCLEKAGLADLLQEIVDAGQPVSCVEAGSGWLEVHSIEDYRSACSMTI